MRAQPRKAVSAPPRGSRQPMFRPFRPCLACWNGARSPSEVGIRGISVGDAIGVERLGCIMATRIVSEKLLRWKGDPDAVRELSVKAQHYIQEQTGSKPTCAVKTTSDKVETLFDSVNEFEAAVRDDFPKLQRIVLTIGPFDRDAELSAEIVLSKALLEPGAAVKARGKNDAYVEWLGKSLLELLERGRRRLPLTTAHLLCLVSLISRGKLFLFSTRNNSPARRPCLLSIYHRCVGHSNASDPPRRLGRQLDNSSA